MSYFKTIKSIDDLKKQFRALAFQHHPDKGGDPEIMKAVNVEYETLYTRWYNVKASEPEYVSPYHSRMNFYQEQGWKGERYSADFSKNDITVRIREYVKKHYPYCKFSVTRKDYNVITVALMSGPFEAFLSSLTDIPQYMRDVMDYLEIERIKQIIKKQHSQVNPYYIKEDKTLSEAAKTILSDIDRYANSFNFDYSDTMSDYFHRNFYFYVHIGKWDKPYVKKGDIKFSSSTDIKTA